MAENKENKRGGCLFFGIVMIVMSVLAFFGTYPPGSEVRIWSKTNTFHYSNWTEIIMTTGVFLALGIMAICAEAILYFRKNRN